MGSTDSPNETLLIVDNRTGRSYVLPIEHNAVRATDFRQIHGPRDNNNNPGHCENDDGLRLFDPGFQNTACLKSEVTLVEGAAGRISYRGIPVVDLYRSGRPFEHVAFFLIFGHLPSAHEAADFTRAIATAELPPQSVFDMIQTLPYQVPDPRALPIQELIEEASVHSEALRKDKTLAVAQEIDRIASQDQYFVLRELAVNPELFISFVYKGIGIPAAFSLVVTGTARAAGLAAHWREVMADPRPRLWRPLQIYTGNVPRRNRGNRQEGVDQSIARAHL